MINFLKKAFEKRQILFCLIIKQLDLNNFFLVFQTNIFFKGVFE